VKVLERPAIVTKTLTDEDDLDELKEEWDRLLDDSVHRSFFLRSRWVRLWWRDLAPRGSRPFVISCRDGTGRLVGLAPLYQVQYTFAGIPCAREIRFLGSNPRERTSEYLDVVARRGYEQPVGEAIAYAIRRTSSWDRLWLAYIPAGSVVLPHLRASLGDSALVEEGEPAHVVETGSDWDHYLKGLGSGLRKNVGYYTRRLLKTHQCEFSRVMTTTALSPAVASLVRLHQARWRAKGEPGSFARPEFERFLKDAIRDSLEEGRLRLWTLAIDGNISAVLLAFYERGRVHYFQGGFDPAYLRDSLGTVMLAMCIRDCFEAGDVNEFDFMAGQGGYKESWTTVTRPNIVLTMARPGARTFAYEAAVRSRRLARNILKTTIPRSLQAVARRWAGRRGYG
jgi:CelD/BcsL family acetyltransferase involved in cellulose biosynthesis